jgi:hypothetical protein
MWHRSNGRNWANKNWRVEGHNRPSVLEVKSRSPVRKRRKLSLNQSLKYIHPFPPLPLQLFFNLFLLNSVAQQNSYVDNILGGGGYLLHLSPLPPPYLQVKLVTEGIVTCSNIGLFSRVGLERFVGGGGAQIHASQGRHRSGNIQIMLTY